MIQSLWGGYGQLYRCRLDDGRSIVVKHIEWPSREIREQKKSLSFQRKERSYRVERNFYKNFAVMLHGHPRVPALLGSGDLENGFWLILEDLDDAGYPDRARGGREQYFQASLEWLAEFHAFFMDVQPDGLWKEGTYWHLDTRPDELKALTDLRLKNAASAIARKLKMCRYQTILHGDPKLENFCYLKDGHKAAAVDFQYTGGGCGMKDLVYLVDASMNEKQAEKRENEILNRYFLLLGENLRKHHPETDPAEVEKEWRPLYRTAWADFHRFLRGWSTDYTVRGGYTDRVIDEVIRGI